MVQETTSRTRRRLCAGGLIAGLLHLLLLGNTVRLILTSDGSPWTQHWVIFLALDFPVSLGVMPVTWLVPASAAGPLRDLSNFWWPGAYHGVVGTVWWYIVGCHLQQRLSRRFGNRHAP